MVKLSWHNLISVKFTYKKRLYIKILYNLLKLHNKNVDEGINHK